MKRRNRRVFWTFVILLVMASAACSTAGISAEDIAKTEVAGTRVAQDPDGSLQIKSAQQDESTASGAPTGEVPPELAPESSNSSAIYIALALAVAFSAGLNLYLLRWLWWKRRHRDGPESIPELLIHMVESEQKQLSESFGDLHKGIAEAIKLQSELSMVVRQDVENLSDSFQVLRDALDSRDDEIRRLKQGYDATIARRLVTRFVKLDIALAEELDALEDSDYLEDLRSLLLDALEECGVQLYSPAVGSEFNTAEGIEENPVHEKTGDNKQDGRISRVIQDGYVLKYMDSDQVIVPAKVAIYKHSQEKDSA